MNIRKKEWYVIAYYAENDEVIEDNIITENNRKEKEHLAEQEEAIDISNEQVNEKLIDKSIIGSPKAGTDGTTLRQRKGKEIPPTTPVTTITAPSSIVTDETEKDQETLNNCINNNEEISLKKECWRENQKHDHDNVDDSTENNKEIDSKEKNPEGEIVNSSKANDESDESESEIEDQDIEYTHYQTKQGAWEAWTEIKKMVKKKDGRGAVLIDCFKSQVTHREGTFRSIDYCREKCIKRGFCMPLGDGNLHPIELITTLYQGIASRTEIAMFLFGIFAMLVNFSVGVQCNLIEGQILSSMVVNPNITSNWRTPTALDEFICTYMMPCDDSYLSLCQTLFVSYIIVRVLNKIFNIANDFLMCVLSDTKTAEMGRDLFIHTLSLDKRFFDETRNIQNYMNVGALHSLLFRIIPEIVTSAIRYLVVAYYLISIHFYLGLFSILFTTSFNFYVVNYFIKKDIDIYKKQRQMDRVHMQITWDTLSMIRTVKLFAKENHHITEYKEWFSKLVHTMKAGAGWRYVREFVDDLVDCFVYVSMIYFGYSRYCANGTMTPGDMTGFMILYGQLHSLYGNVRDNLTYLGREFGDIERYNALKVAKSKMVKGSKKPNDIKGMFCFFSVLCGLLQISS